MAHESDERALIISSDGHATARMTDYRPYIPAGNLEEFDAFCEVYARDGARTTEPASLLQRIDPDIVDLWVHDVIEPGRLAGQYDPNERLTQLDHEGISAELIFPDFGLPYELHPPLIAAIRGYSRTFDQITVANQAYNRWLADFSKADPERLGGLAVIAFDDVDLAVSEIRWAKDNGLKGVVLPSVDENKPFFHADYEPIWSTLEELELPVNTHTAISSITRHMATGTLTSVPHPACALPIMTAQAFFACQQILTHLIWGGVLERHPNLHVALTEQGSGWVVTALRGMDYSWENSYLRRDVRDVVSMRPSDYFERQVHMGSSLFSRAEAQARHEIGVHKINIGMDYPHHEGTWGAGPGTTHWLRATLGAAAVPVEEARRMLGGNAAELWGFDEVALRPVADRIGPRYGDILAAPEEDLFPRGDVNKPLATAF